MIWQTCRVGLHSKRHPESQKIMSLNISGYHVSRDENHISLTRSVTGFERISKILASLAIRQAMDKVSFRIWSSHILKKILGKKRKFLEKKCVWKKFLFSQGFRVHRNKNYQKTPQTFRHVPRKFCTFWALHVFHLFCSFGVSFRTKIGNQRVEKWTDLESPGNRRRNKRNKGGVDQHKLTYLEEGCVLDILLLTYIWGDVVFWRLGVGCRHMAFRIIWWTELLVTGKKNQKEDSMCMCIHGLANKQEPQR